MDAAEIAAIAERRQAERLAEQERKQISKSQRLEFEAALTVVCWYGCQLSFHPILTAEQMREWAECFPRFADVVTRMGWRDRLIARVAMFSGSSPYASALPIRQSKLLLRQAVREWLVQRFLVFQEILKVECDISH